MTLGETLKARRLEWSRQEPAHRMQRDAAEEFGISTNFLSLIENDKRLPSITLLKRIATVYNCTIELQINPNEEHDIWRTQ